jgi:hypothetical protein
LTSYHYFTHLTCPHLLQVRLCEAEGATCTALVADVGSSEMCKNAVRIVTTWEGVTIQLVTSAIVLDASHEVVLVR